MGGGYPGCHCCGKPRSREAVAWGGGGGAAWRGGRRVGGGGVVPTPVRGGGLGWVGGVNPQGGGPWVWGAATCRGFGLRGSRAGQRVRSLCPRRLSLGPRAAPRQAIAATSRRTP